MEELSEQSIALFQRLVQEWYDINGRILPWRQSRDPYSILIAEKLLQQTSVRIETISVYSLLLNKYPTVSDLAHANANEIREIIIPLGLHYRAQEMVLMAQEITGKFDSKIPDNLVDLLSIRGIGDYTARAVLCFAYGMDVPVVDTNIARILHRVLYIPGKIPSNPARNSRLIRIMENLIPSSKSQSFNWGMIDLGASTCKPNPHCSICPLIQLCLYFTEVINKE